MLSIFFFPVPFRVRVGTRVECDEWTRFFLSDSSPFITLKGRGRLTRTNWDAFGCLTSGNASITSYQAFIRPLRCDTAECLTVGYSSREGLEIDLL